MAGEAAGALWDDVVELSASSSAERIPTAVTASHAVVIDLFILLALV